MSVLSVHGAGKRCTGFIDIIANGIGISFVCRDDACIVPATECTVVQNIVYTDHYVDA